MTSGIMSESSKLDLLVAALILPFHQNDHVRQAIVRKLCVPKTLSELMT
jgi:hypothetical protein